MRKEKCINDKGFSLVELIIVIAIMAILAGALAPQLIKYIDNSRKSTDVQTGQTIATAVSVALANEEAYDAAVEETDGIFWISDLPTSTNDFEKKVAEIIGTTIPKPKYRGTVGSVKYDDFAIVIDKDGVNLSFKIYPAVKAAFSETANAEDIVYPTVGDNYVD